MRNTATKQNKQYMYWNIPDEFINVVEKNNNEKELKVNLFAIEKLARDMGC